MKDIKTFVIEEYKTAVQLTYHIDQLRNNITSFFLIFAGVLTALMLAVFEKKVDSTFFDIDKTIYLVCYFIGFVGIIIVLILARLRYVQLEHFRIINNIRKYQTEPVNDLDNNDRIKEALTLGNQTLPVADFFTGTYYWLCLVILTGAVIVGLGTYYLTNQNIWLSLMVSLIYVIIDHLLYFKLANDSKWKKGVK